jgi:hypothetical protein
MTEDGLDAYHDHASALKWTCRPTTRRSWGRGEHELRRDCDRSREELAVTAAVTAGCRRERDGGGRAGHVARDRHRRPEGAATPAPSTRCCSSTGPSRPRPWRGWSSR